MTIHRFGVRTVATLFIVLGAGAVLLWNAGTRADESTGADDRLSQLGWFKGHWAATVDGNPLEEYWSAPLADSMIGAFRWLKDGKLWMSEYITIMADADVITMRIKHYDRNMVGWEEKDKAITVTLIRATSDEAVFETPDKDDFLRITYLRKGTNELTVRLEGMRDGELKGKEFQFEKREN